MQKGPTLHIFASGLHQKGAELNLFASSLMLLGAMLHLKASKLHLLGASFNHSIKNHDTRLIGYSVSSILIQFFRFIVEAAK